MKKLFTLLPLLLIALFTACEFGPLGQMTNDAITTNDEGFFTKALIYTEYDSNSGGTTIGDFRQFEKKIVTTFNIDGSYSIVEYFYEDGLDMDINSNGVINEGFIEVLSMEGQYTYLEYILTIYLVSETSHVDDATDLWINEAVTDTYQYRQVTEESYYFTDNTKCEAFVVQPDETWKRTYRVYVEGNENGAVDYYETYALSTTDLTFSSVYYTVNLTEWTLELFDSYPADADFTEKLTL